MIMDLLKVRLLITIADILNPEDYDKLDGLHEAVLNGEEDLEVSQQIADLYEKYRTKE
jgi:hypothetical protein